MNFLAGFFLGIIVGYVVCAVGHVMIIRELREELKSK